MHFLLGGLINLAKKTNEKENHPRPKYYKKLKTVNYLLAADQSIGQSINHLIKQVLGPTTSSFQSLSLMYFI